MKAITLWEPWATAIVEGFKRNETRSWETSHRGLIAIHAAKRRTEDQKEYLAEMMARHPEVYESYQVFNGDAHWWDVLPFGKVIGYGHLASCDRIGPRLERGLHPIERDFGDYSHGRFAWRLVDVKRHPKGIDCKGYQQLWTLPEDVASRLLMECEPVIYRNEQ